MLGPSLRMRKKLEYPPGISDPINKIFLLVLLDMYNELSQVLCIKQMEEFIKIKRVKYANESTNDIYHIDAKHARIQKIS